MMVLSATYSSTPLQILIEDRLIQLRQKIVQGQAGAEAVAADDANLAETEGVALAVAETAEARATADEPQVRQDAPPDRPADRAATRSGTTEVVITAADGSSPERSASVISLREGETGGALNLAPGAEAVIRIDGALASGLNEVGIGWTGIDTVRLTFATGGSILVRGVSGASLALQFGNGQAHHVSRSAGVDRRI
ncbi:hypothetical protein FDP22_02200 [Paroceanicella profunda]|uniref:Uncharacterized protein n=1 Tax=Paroceanicella profunda TaxID=2579971 RepID=A0A5B8FG24_9RHOB|nr:hypothetical protein [Paroceanicella profunda]QDL90701.1 hypothetical protein FDP22_02200 [Paroceanicella profunda]